jgi:hypothetical protein
LATPNFLPTRNPEEPIVHYLARKKRLGYYKLKIVGSQKPGEAAEWRASFHSHIVRGGKWTGKWRRSPLNSRFQNKAGLSASKNPIASFLKKYKSHTIFINVDDRHTSTLINDRGVWYRYDYHRNSRVEVANTKEAGWEKKVMKHFEGYLGSKEKEFEFVAVKPK